MNVVPTDLPGVVIIEPKVFGDVRGFFIETWQRERYASHGIGPDFVQDNLSRSSRGVLRGLHYQWPNPQGKLVSVLEGEVIDVAVDVRLGSPNFGRWTSVRISAENKRQLFVPPGFAHGFAVTSETALFAYKCTDYYYPQFDHGIRYDDPAIGVAWETENPTLSAKDGKMPLLAEIPQESLPRYVPA
ncbi:MAG: dTDP-4-dehydrorhamnose 3,5-epimerase [Planctomycetia bacterium]|nr:dTDP-4-dehydrorhamnose 3,5-epimerase [Planctomycetia bacterium]